MIDQSKRTTLKQMGVAAVASTITALAGSALAGASPDTNDQALKSGNALRNLADIQVQTHVSAISNDIEVVISNVGADTARITSMTPSQTSTRRGVFRFSPLLRDGELTLAAGQSVRVPMTPHPVVLDASTTATQRAQSLSAALRSSFSVITDEDAFARVTIVDGIRFV